MNLLQTGCRVVLATLELVSTSAVAEIPHLAKHGTATQLVVDGKPFLVLGGELHNSSSSCVEYVTPIPARFSAGHLSTALVAVGWDVIEPEEGKFDFGLVDGLLQAARRNHLRLVLLWFGSWKNGVSTYPPAWVKTDLQRFPRAQGIDGKSLEILSTLSEANREADARAFGALRRHVRESDGDAQTVLMVQVENEVGVLGESRDRSAAANETFQWPAPKELIEYLQEHKDVLVPEFHEKWEDAGFKTAGSWEDLFGAGEETDEMFMAWNYARYVNRVTEAGGNHRSICHAGLFSYTHR